MKTPPAIGGYGPFGGAATFAVACLLLSGCGSSDAASSAPACSSQSAFPSEPLATVTSNGGALHVELHATPYQPMVAGVGCIELVVTDSTTGASVDDLSVTMTPWMPAMGHGTSVRPVLTPLGEGRYVFTNVSLFMPGEWQLRTQFSGQVNDSVAPTFNVD
jgi:hypothetical protein